jgi:uncharacterized NAD-dependent epimerase/dehydratase family protein
MNGICRSGCLAAASGACGDGDSAKLLNGIDASRANAGAMSMTDFMAGFVAWVVKQAWQNRTDIAFFPNSADAGADLR